MLLFKFCFSNHSYVFPSTEKWNFPYSIHTHVCHYTNQHTHQAQQHQHKDEHKYEEDGDSRQSFYYYMVFLVLSYFNIHSILFHFHFDFHFHSSNESTFTAAQKGCNGFLMQIIQFHYDLMAGCFIYGDSSKPEIPSFYIDARRDAKGAIGKLCVGTFKIHIFIQLGWNNCNNFILHTNVRYLR